MVKIILEILFFILLTILKFLFVPYAMLEANYQFFEVIFIHSSGAALGVYIFYNFGPIIFKLFKRKKKRKSTKTKRWIIKVKNRFGLRGLLLISGLISVPIAALLAARYFRSNTTLSYVVMGFFFWSVGLTGLSYLIYNWIH